MDNNQIGNALCTSPLALRVLDPFSVCNAIIAWSLLCTGPHRLVLLQGLAFALFVVLDWCGVDLVTADHFGSGDQ